MCDVGRVGYLCANFSIPRPICSRLRSDAIDRQTAASNSCGRHGELTNINNVR